MPASVLVDVDCLLLPDASATHALAWSAAVSEVLRADLPVSPDAVAGLPLSAHTDPEIAGHIVGAHIRVGEGALGWAHRLLRELDDAYREVWAAAAAPVCPYPQAAVLLRALRAADVPIVAISGRLRVGAAAALNAAGLAGLFDTLVTGELPDRDALIGAALRDAIRGGAKPVLLTAAGSATAADLAAARRYGMHTAVVAPGQRRGERIPADVVLPGLGRAHLPGLLTLRG